MGNQPCADLRYGEEDSISPSTLFFAALMSNSGYIHTTLLLALPAVKIWQIWRLQVDGLARRSKLFLSYYFIYTLTWDMWHKTSDLWHMTCDPATPGLLSIQNTALAVKGIPLWYFWQEIYLDSKSESEAIVSVLNLLEEILPNIPILVHMSKIRLNPNFGP